MDTEAIDNDIAARLKRLEASATPAVSFGYDALIDRHAAKQVRAGRRLKVARGTASVLIVALVAASVWRFDQPLDGEAVVNEPVAEENSQASQPRIVRADSYLAVAALEDHIATLDDALNVARLRGGSAEVARLERTRAELFDSYTQVRYAQLVSANF
jgi:hypothetical protein